MGREPFDYLLLPFRVFTTNQMYADFEGSLGLGLGLLILLSLISFRQFKKQEHWLVYFAMGWSILWAFQVQQIRFLMPAIPLFFLLSIPILSQRISGLAPIVFILSLLSSITPFQQFWKAQSPLYFYKHNTEIFLNKQLPENYPIYQYVNKIETKKIWMVWMRGYHYYLDHPARIDSVIEGYRFENLLNQSNPAEINQILQQENIPTTA